MEQEKISLKEVIELCNDYYSKKIDKEDLSDFGNKIAIKPYISLLEKSGLILVIMTQLSYTSEDVVTRISELTMNKFFYCLIGAYTNIEIDDEYVTLNNYDLIAPLFKKFILQFCSDDYMDLESMIRDTIQVGNLEQLLDMFSNVDSRKLKEASQDFKNTITDLEKNKNIIENIKDIASFNDPIMNKVIEQMKEKAVSEAAMKTE